MIYYKLTQEDGTSIYAPNYKYPPIGEWTEPIPIFDLKMCFCGYHLCHKKDVAYWSFPSITKPYFPNLYEAEADTIKIEGYSKVLTNKMRLTKYLGNIGPSNIDALYEYFLSAHYYDCLFEYTYKICNYNRIQRMLHVFCICNDTNWIEVLKP